MTKRLCWPESARNRGLSRRAFVKLSAATALGVATDGTRRVMAAQKSAASAGPPALDASYPYYCPELVEITKPGPIILPDGTSRPYTGPVIGPE